MKSEIRLLSHNSQNPLMREVSKIKIDLKEITWGRSLAIPTLWLSYPTTPFHQDTLLKRSGQLIDKTLKKVLIFGFILTHFVTAQDWYLRDHGIIIEGQSPINLSDIKIINRSIRTWQPDTDIKLVFPKDFEMVWADSNTKVMRRGIRLNATTETIGQTLTINLLTQIRPGGTLTISGLVLKKFIGSTPFRSIGIEVNGKNGNLIDPRIIRKWGDQSIDNIFSKFFFIFITDFIQDIYEDLHPFYYNLPSRTPGVFRIARLTMDLEKEVCFITNTEQFPLPPLVITNDSLKSILTKNTELVITFPNELKVNFDEVRISPAGKVIGPKYNKPNSYKLKIKKVLRSDESIVVEGIKLTSDRRTIVPKKIALEWRNALQVTPVQLFSHNTIRIGNPKIRLKRDIELVANAPVSEVPTLQIIEDDHISTITKKRDIFIEIPSNIKAYWSTDFRNISLTGSAASKVHLLPIVHNRKNLEFNVTEDFKPGETLEISHLKMFAQSRSEEDQQSKKIRLRLPLTIYFNEPRFRESRNTDGQIKIVEVDVSSKDHQVMLAYDEKKKAKPIRISLKSDFVVLKKGDKLRFGLSEGFDGHWDPTMRKINLTGPSGKKVDNTVLLDIQYPRSFILQVTENFEGDEEFQMDGLFLVSSGKPSIGEFEMYLNDESEPLSKDDKNWIIQKPIFSAKEDQVIFDADSITKSFSFTLNTKDLSDYFDTGAHILIVIPSKIPVNFNTKKTKLNLYGSSVKFLSENVDFLDDRKARISIINPVPPNSTLLISGLEYAEPTGLTAYPDTIYCLISKGSNKPIHCKKSISIVSKESEYESALYYSQLAESNFPSEDTVFLNLDPDKLLVWDEKYIRRNFKLDPPPATGEIEIDSILFLNERSLGLIIRKTLTADDFFRIYGLAVRIKYEGVNDFSYLTLRYVNLYGPQEVMFKYPINIGAEGTELKIQIPIFFTESYIYPLLTLFKEEDSILLTSQKDRVILPIIEIQNGLLAPEDKQTYNLFTSTESDLTAALNKGNLKRTENRARELIRIAPHTWKGYYYLANVQKKIGQFSESQSRYTQAKQFGYIPSQKFPPLYEATIDDQSLADILRAEELLEKKEYILAEDMLEMVIKHHPDSLRDDIRGTAYFLMGEIALRLNDCLYAEDYLFSAHDYGVIDEERYDLLRAESRLDSCLVPSDTTQELLVIQPPIPEDDKLSERINLTISSSFGYPYRLSIGNRNKSEIFSTRMEDEVEIQSQNIYRLTYHPVRSQIGSFILSWVAVILILGLSL